MSRSIPIISFDPSFSNFGMAKCQVDVDTLELKIEDLILISTTREDKKEVIKTSSDLYRARALVEGIQLHCQGRAFAISEIPLGNAALYKNAILSAGIVTGVLASCPIPLIQVSPTDVKLAAVGHRQASKEEMIEWGTATYPDAPWMYFNRKGQRVRHAANEHLADAVAAALAGIQTDQFQQARAMYRSMKAAA